VKAAENGNRTGPSYSTAESRDKRFFRLNAQIVADDGLILKGHDGKRTTIAPKNCYLTTRAKAERLSLDGLTGEARQVYAALDLWTIAEGREVAIIREENGTVREVTVADLAGKTRLAERCVRRGLAELDQAKLILRLAVDGGPPRAGVPTRIYSVAEPEISSIGQARPISSSFVRPSWYPEAWLPLLPLMNRRDGAFAISEADVPVLLEQGKAAARALEETVLPFVNRICPRPIRGKARPIPEKTSDAPGSTAKPAQNENPAPVPPPSANGHPVDSTAGGEIQRTSPSSSSNGFPLPSSDAPISMPPSAPPQPTPDPDTPILEAAEESGISLDADAVRRLNAGCRKIQADATPEEIAHFVRVKGAAARKLKASNPPGFLIDGVPKCLEGEPFLRFRRAQAKAKADAEAKDARIAALPSQEELDAIREREEAEAEARIALLCPACKGLGRDVNNPWKDKNQCRACGGTGRRPESRGAP
jgi:hypothetical protein